MCMPAIPSAGRDFVGIRADCTGVIRVAATSMSLAVSPVFTACAWGGDVVACHITC